MRYRNNMLHAFDNGEPNTVILSWSGINSLLPDDYKVEINTDKYNKLMQENKVIACSKCKEKIPHQDVSFQTVLLPTVSSMVIHKDHERVWSCSKCSNENIFNPRQIKIVKFQAPYYLGVVPEAPERQFGIRGRSSFNAKFNRWFAIALDEIESKIGKYRADYIAQMEADDIKLGEDEDHST